MTAQHAPDSRAPHANSLRLVGSDLGEAVAGSHQNPEGWSSSTADLRVLHLLTRTLTELVVGTLARREAGPQRCACPTATIATAPDLTGDIFRREGEYWTLAWRGGICRLRDVRGLHYIAQLLRDPGRTFHALDLVNADSARVLPARRSCGVEVLDGRAKAAYRQRLRDLRDELEEGERLGDAERVTRAQFEREAITEQLAAAVGLGGRNRLAAATERARCAVTQGIRNALKRVRKVLPALADELGLRIKTGVYCVYIPDPANPTAWVL